MHDLDTMIIPPGDRKSTRILLWQHQYDRIIEILLKALRQGSEPITAPRLWEELRLEGCPGLGDDFYYHRVYHFLADKLVLDRITTRGQTTLFILPTEDELLRRVEHIRTGGPNSDGDEESARSRPTPRRPESSAKASAGGAMTQECILNDLQKVIIQYMKTACRGRARIRKGSVDERSIDEDFDAVDYHFQCPGVPVHRYPKNICQSFREVEAVVSFCPEHLRATLRDSTDFNAANVREFTVGYGDPDIWSLLDDLIQELQTRTQAAIARHGHGRGTFLPVPFPVRVT